MRLLSVFLPACLATGDGATNNNAATNNGGASTNGGASNNGGGNAPLPTEDSDFTILHCNNQETQRARVSKYSYLTMKVLTVFRA